MYMVLGNASCALGDCLTSRPEGCSQPRELWFSIYSCTWASGSVQVYMYVCFTICGWFREQPHPLCLFIAAAMYMYV